MPYIQTAMEKIAPSELGVTLMHEHLLWDQSVYHAELDRDDPQNAVFFREIRMEDLSFIWRNMHQHRHNTIQKDESEAADELSLYAAAGGKSLLDLSCRGISVHPEEAKRISEKTGLNVILATGVYVEGSCPEAKLSCAEKEAVFEKELTCGIADTDICANVIGELGVGATVTENVEETLTAAAHVQGRLRVPVFVHQSSAIFCSHDILDVIEKNGGLLDKTVLCHVDALCGDIPYLTSLMDRGANLSFDQFALEFPMSLGKNNTLWLPRDIERVRCIARLCELGYSDRIVMSHDISFRVCYSKYGGNGYAHILKNIVPYLREEGVRENALRRLLVENPARILTRDI